MAIKIFFFDLEGTLIINHDGSEHSTLWGRIPLALGDEAVKEDERLYAMWERGEHKNYVAWCDASMESYRRFGLTKKILRELLSEATLREQVSETIAEIHKRGIITVIISGGFHQQAAQLQVQLGIRHALCGTQIYWNRDGTIAGWNSLPANNEGKIDFMELMIREYKITKEECAFIGNGSNDIAIAKHAGISFAVPDAHESLKTVATHTINDFRDILKHI